MANKYANLVGANKINAEFTKINDGFAGVEADMNAEVAAREQTDADLTALDTRVDTIIQGGGPDKDAELVDIRTPDESYTPEVTISVAGDMTRDMQAQFMSHKAEDVSDGVHGMGAAAAEDYEEGTFTPELKFGGATTGITYTFQLGRYTLIGNVLHFELHIALSSKGTATGDATITGQPFTSNSAKPSRSYAAGEFSALDLPTNGTIVTLFLSEGSSEFTVRSSGDNQGITAITNANFNNNTVLRTSGFYII